MIPRTADWKNALADAVRDPAELLALLELPRELLPAARSAGSEFTLRVPRGFVARMERGNPHDPLLRQVLPIAAELEVNGGFVTDPVGDAAAGAADGVLHKYHGRALLMPTGACAVHCRYCFRRHFAYADQGARPNAWEQGVAYLRTRPELSEVILSGGDPLMLDDRRLSALTDALAQIPHLKRLRIHSRMPIVLPERIDDGFLSWFRGLPLQKVVVLHGNHAREVDAAVGDAIARLAAAGGTLLNQAVLLRGVNDSVEAQAALAERLFDHGVMPYYLHLLDRVHGAAHFEVPETEALALVESLRRRLPGYLVPQLVREQAGAPSKLPRVASPGHW